MIMRLFKKNSPWLLVFLGGSGDEEEHLKTYIDMARDIRELTPPKYKSIRFDTGKTRAFPTGVPAKNELAELFSEAVINELIEKKRKFGAANVALIIAADAFPNLDVFKEVVQDSINDNDVYDLMCSSADFRKSEPRKKCYAHLCGGCGNLDGCLHSCLPRLLWLMFNKDERVLRVFGE